MNTESSHSSYFSFATMKDYIDRTKTIWEKVSDTNIQILYENEEASISGNAGYATINIPPLQDEKGQKINFNHESAHILFDSLIPDFGAINSKLYISDIPQNIQDKHLSPEIIRVFQSCTNIIDDERVESLMGEVYYGTGKDFKEKTYDMGLKFTQMAKDPISALFMARFQRPDLIPKEYKGAIKAIEDVRLTEKEGTIIVSNNYIKQYIIPFIIKNLPDKDNGLPPTPTALTQMFSDSYRQARKCDHTRYGRQSFADNKIIEKGDLKELKALGVSKVGEVKDKIEHEARAMKNLLMPDADKIDMIDRYKDYNDYEVNAVIANGMNKILRNIQAKKKIKLTDSGDVISIPEIIKRKARGFGDKVFVNHKRISSLEVTVSIDASGSMANTIEVARDMVATMFKGIEGVKGINLEAVIWGGGHGGHVGITVINNIKQCKSIRIADGYGGTPTPYAVEFSVRSIERRKGKNKLLVIITDGSPSGIGDGYRNAYELTYDEVKRARKKNIGVFGMFIGGYESNAMDRLFGKGGYMVVEDMNEASGKMLNKFQKIVLEQVKRSK